MTRVDELFDRYRAAFTAGEDPDPTPYVEQLEGADRRELALLIDAYLERAPRRHADHDPERIRADPLAQRILRETWRSLLPEARDRAKLPRDELVARLADALGVAGQREKVHDYYHGMEQGTLPAAGVSERVLRALGEVVGVSVERLRAAGRRTLPPAGGTVFARSGAGRPPPGGPAGKPRMEPEERDEVDELFTGGFQEH